MRFLFFFILVAAPGLSAAQGLLEFRRDLAFDARTVEAVAERSYRGRVEQLAGDGRLDTNPTLPDRLHGLLARLLPAAHFEHPDSASIVWEIHTCRRCDEKASAMAGGRLLIGEEFVSDFALSDDELGYVLAHEMAHVLAEHIREYATTARFFIGNGQRRNYRDIQNELDESIVANLHLAVEYKRQELEADYMGFVLGARSGFDPEAMIGMLGKLPQPARSAFGLHPDHAERMARAQAMLSTAQRLYEIGVPDR
jgi:predicted Zn-dependent protease